MQSRKAQSVPPAVSNLHWNRATCIAFRFAFVYLGLYALASQVFSGMFLAFVSGPPNYSFRNLGHVWPMRDLTLWTGTRLFGAGASLVHTGNSGDSAFYWAQTFWILIAACAATAIWTGVDRERAHHAKLHAWFRFAIRIALAAEMLYYGMAKVIPTQFPAPSLATLVSPVGNVSLQGFLWTSIGASPAYQIFTGIAEVVAGLLLLIPATATLGSLVTSVVMIEIFVLNMTYDIGLKQISFHLLLMSGFLLAPCVPPFLDFFIRSRTASPFSEPQLFATAQANRAILVLQVVLCFYFLGMYCYISRSWWFADGGGTPRSALYGIWNIESMSVDGAVQPAVMNDYDRRWRRVIFDAPDSAIFQRTDDSFARYRSAIDLSKQQMTLAKGGSPSWRMVFQFAQPANGRLTFDGDMDGHRIHLELEKVELDTFRLLESGFRWVRPPDPATIVD